MPRARFMERNQLSAAAIWGLLGIATASWWSELSVTKFLLTVASLLQVLQGILGPVRRRSSSSFVRYGAWAAFHGPFYLATCAAGNMLFSFHEDINVLAWGMILSDVLIPTPHMAAYSITGGAALQHYQTTNAKQLWYLFCYIWATIRVCVAVAWTVQTILFLTFVVYKISSRVVIPLALSAAWTELGGGDAAAAGAAAAAADDDVSAELGGGGGAVAVAADDEDDELILVSYLSFQWLKRRFFSSSWSPLEGDEARLDSARSRLLSADRDGYQGAFRVVEVQLGFLYDEFFTGFNTDSANSMDMAQDYSDNHLSFSLIFHGIAWPAIIGLTFYGSGLGLAALAIAVNFVGEPLSRARFFTSDRGKVFWARRATRGRSGPPRALRPVTAVSALFNPNHGYWQERIGQYSLLLDYDRGSLRRALVAHAVAFAYGAWSTSIAAMHHPKEEEAVTLPADLRRQLGDALALVVSRHEGGLSKGTRSLRRNGISSGYCLGTINQPHHAHTVLVWHIATCYCEMEPCNNRAAYGHVRSFTYYDIATKLSRYCAYLMAFLPELLPDGAYITSFMFQKVVKEAKTCLEGASSKEGKYSMMKNLGLDLQSTSPFVAGVNLGKLLQQQFALETRWKVIADFWVETMLYIAPSYDAATHINMLAQGGEFITHIWALLFNQGITERPAFELESESSESESE